MAETNELETNAVVPDRTSISGRLDTNWILSRHIDRLGAQVLKLPTEMYQTGSNMAAGIEYSDIQQSFVDGVNLLLGLLEPLEVIDDATNFKDAYVKFRRAVKTLQNENLMYQREKHVILDEENGVVYESQPSDSQVEEPIIEDDMATTAP
jgi:hypothetical protein